MGTTTPVTESQSFDICAQQSESETYDHYGE